MNLNTLFLVLEQLGFIKGNIDINNGIIKATFKKEKGKVYLELDNDHKSYYVSVYIIKGFLIGSETKEIKSGNFEEILNFIKNES